VVGHVAPELGDSGDKVATVARVELDRSIRPQEHEFVKVVAQRLQAKQSSALPALCVCGGACAVVRVALEKKDGACLELDDLSVEVAFELHGELRQLVHLDLRRVGAGGEQEPAIARRLHALAGHGELGVLDELQPSPVVTIVSAKPSHATISKPAIECIIAQNKSNHTAISICGKIATLSDHQIKSFNQNGEI
jgi:hypothetical protein